MTADADMVMVAVTDVRGRILDVNDRFCEISRFTRDELVGQIIASSIRDTTRKPS